MEYISVFDMLKIGVGPSSSHTLGPWLAGGRWLQWLKDQAALDRVNEVKVHLYGSLSLTGRGHGTDLAVILGLNGADPKTVPIASVHTVVDAVSQTHKLSLGGMKAIYFNPSTCIVFHKEFLPFHANGLMFEGILDTGEIKTKTYYSIGGGFVEEVDGAPPVLNLKALKMLPFPVKQGADLLKFCHENGLSISQLVLENELSLRNDADIDKELRQVWETMLECVYLGCHTEGSLPGGLHVKRRAAKLHQNLKIDLAYSSSQEWVAVIRKTPIKFRQIFQWVSCFALAVNEENASFGRVVTAPTNGSAGVIPAVLMYYLTIENHDADWEDIKKFFLVAGVIGSIFKMGATISAAMGGCQAEIGVSSAMAAGALTELMGGTPEQVLMASEIAMEHHLGLTCDPIGGLVQIPCIERNSMGAIKAITATELALNSDPEEAKVSLDKVVSTMWETAKDMNSKYKETAEGGLAITVGMINC
ncbi:MAG: L-serine ammonia-lyase [Cyclobacteriaceae bacterium]